ncbi:hypothetical protein EV424DRAFT_1344814 [Suillus variegatus]|nr:hypothetical protein EV424DRAFT_1352940 [Suillus variegatus]KAG1828316.1 hypothetical protein EV424DRAFT_1344814 [Suillus variegatus]
MYLAQVVRMNGDFGKGADMEEYSLLVSLTWVTRGNRICTRRQRTTMRIWTHVALYGMVYNFLASVLMTARGHCFWELEQYLAVSGDDLLHSSIDGPGRNLQN